jgi:O-methyltransferase
VQRYSYFWVRKLIWKLIPTEFLIKHRILRLLFSVIPNLCEFPQEIPIVLSFLFNQNLSNITFFQRLYLVIKFYLITLFVDSFHKQSEILKVVEAIFSLPRNIDGCIVEAGVYKGGSTAKFSLACRMVGKKLIAFDSFKGLPDNNENFPKGAYYGSIDEVIRNVSRFGCIEVCKFVRGDFKNTMSKFSKKIALLYLDIDLATSTKICLKYLYPLLVPRGILYSHDGHLPPVIRVFKDEKMWNEMNYKKPYIEGLGESKLIRIVKRQ